MADCTKHDELVREQAKLKSELSALKESVDNGWIVIRKTEDRVDGLEKTQAESNEKINSIFRMMKDMTKAIQGIDEKLDEYIKDVRKDVKETNRRLYELETKSAINTNNINWNWKSILAAGTVITFLLSVILQFFS